MKFPALPTWHNSNNLVTITSWIKLHHQSKGSQRHRGWRGGHGGTACLHVRKLKEEPTRTHSHKGNALKPLIRPTAMQQEPKCYLHPTGSKAASEPPGTCWSLRGLWTHWNTKLPFLCAHNMLLSTGHGPTEKKHYFIKASEHHTEQHKQKSLEYDFPEVSKPNQIKKALSQRLAWGLLHWQQLRQI